MHFALFDALKTCLTSAPVALVLINLLTAPPTSACLAPSTMYDQSNYKELLGKHYMEVSPACAANGANYANAGGSLGLSGSRPSSECGCSPTPNGITKKYFTKADLPTKTRVLPKGSVVTLDFDPDRLNVHLDEHSIAVKVNYG